MEFTATRNDIVTPLSHIIGAIDRRSGIPLLDNVHMTLEDHRLNLTASDNEIEMSISTPVHTDSPGTITVPARKLLDICKNLGNNADVKFQLNDNNALLRSGRSRYKLTTLPARDFPIVDLKDSDTQEIALQAREFLACLKMTAASMAKQDVRFYLVGSLLEIDDQHMTCVSTDGHRLAKMTASVLSSPKTPIRIIVPRKAVLELKSLLASADPNAEVTLLASSTNLDATVGDMCLKTKLVDGRFPDYKRVIPASTGERITVNKEDFRSALTRASILANDKYKGVSMHLSSGVMKLTSNNPDLEESADEIDITYTGTAINIGFNVNYMLDAIASFDTDDVCLNLTDSNTSALITSDSSECLHVVMPMRL